LTRTPRKQTRLTEPRWWWPVVSLSMCSVAAISHVGHLWVEFTGEWPAFEAFLGTTTLVTLAVGLTYMVLWVLGNLISGRIVSAGEAYEMGWDACEAQHHAETGHSSSASLAPPVELRHRQRPRGADRRP